VGHSKKKGKKRGETRGGSHYMATKTISVTIKRNFFKKEKTNVGEGGDQRRRKNKRG
jgi:hypothetical protein